MKDANPPRFVPILTEVVKAQAPSEAALAAASGSASGSDLPPDHSPEFAPEVMRGSAVDEDELARRVLERVLLELEPIVLDALRTVQAQQARSLEVMVRAELATRVAQVVSDALAARPRD